MMLCLNLMQLMLTEVAEINAGNTLEANRLKNN